MYNKYNEGITLIALIITIIILLILAVVTIEAIINDGIINYAQKSSEIYGNAKEDEKSVLGNYFDFLNNKVTSTEIIKFKVNTEEYEAIKGMKWSDWLESAYNTDEVNADKFFDGKEYIVSFKDDILNYSSENNNLSKVTVEMEIIENGEYITAGDSK